MILDLRYKLDSGNMEKFVRNEVTENQSTVKFGSSEETERFCDCR